MFGSQTFFHPRLLLKSSSEVEHFMRNAPEYALD